MLGQGGNQVPVFIQTHNTFSDHGLEPRLLSRGPKGQIPQVMSILKGHCHSHLRWVWARKPSAILFWNRNHLSDSAPLLCWHWLYHLMQQLQVDF